MNRPKRSRNEPRAALACPGKSQEARGLLAPVYGWFTEGLETLRMQAKALLDELAAP